MTRRPTNVPSDVMGHSASKEAPFERYLIARSLGKVVMRVLLASYAPQRRGTIRQICRSAFEARTPRRRATRNPPAGAGLTTASTTSRPSTISEPTPGWIGLISPPKSACHADRNSSSASSAVAAPVASGENSACCIQPNSDRSSQSRAPSTTAIVEATATLVANVDCGADDAAY